MENKEGITVVPCQIHGATSERTDLIMDGKIIHRFCTLCYFDFLAKNLTDYYSKSVIFEPKGETI